MCSMRARKEDPIHVVIVEEHAVLREALALLVEHHGPYKVVLKCAPGEELREAMEHEEGAALLLLGIHHASAPGSATLPWIVSHHPEVKVIVYTLAEDDGLVLGAYRAGARAVLTKGFGAAMLTHALDAVATVGVFHDAITQRILLENPDGLSAEERQRQKLLAQIPPHLFPVLEQICRSADLTYKAMAPKLELSQRTVEAHACELFEIFGVGNKTALAMAAVRLGIVRI